MNNRESWQLSRLLTRSLYDGLKYWTRLEEMEGRKEKHTRMRNQVMKKLNVFTKMGEGGRLIED